eukprot:TRINITY_DN71385_c0_g1_i1.p1 TRINITY_DN71385_c0_g1~~TRINITY_DN71385_c0_g1_i1.p1  ORF type:complete len:547 (-),score=96.89 TRINITY_DN71385_c0_g1_i1:17-1657(-)
MALRGASGATAYAWPAASPPPPRAVQLTQPPVTAMSSATGSAALLGLVAAFATGGRRRPSDWRRPWLRAARRRLRLRVAPLPRFSSGLLAPLGRQLRDIGMSPGGSFLKRRVATPNSVDRSRLEPADRESMSVPAQSVAALLAASALSLLGFTMPGPILPLLRVQYALSADQVGLVSSAFAVGMLFAVTVLPAVSDRRGRKHILVGAMASTATGFLVQGFVLRHGFSFNVFLLVRFLTGLFAGCNPIFKAYLADVAPTSRLSQFMVYREAAATLAFVVGPTIGGMLAMSALGAAAPLYATAAAHGIGSLLVAALVVEPRRLEPEAATTAKPTAAAADGASAEADVRGEKNEIEWMSVIAVFMMSFFYVIGQSGFSSFFPILMDDRFGMQPQEIGIFTTKFSLLALFIQALGYRPLVRRLGLGVTSALGAIALGVGLAGMGGSLPFLAAAGLYAVGVATFPATIPTLLTSSVPASRRGFVLGLDSIANNVCRIIAPMALGVLYAHSADLCFRAAGASMLLVLCLLAALMRRPTGAVVLKAGGPSRVS